MDYKSQADQESISLLLLREANLPPSLLNNFYKDEVLYPKLVAHLAQAHGVTISADRLFGLARKERWKVIYEPNFTAATQQVQQAAAQQLYKNTLIEQKTSELSSLLTEQNIAHAFIGGVPFAYAFYSRPEERATEKLDLLVSPDNLPLVTELLKGRGFSPGKPLFECRNVQESFVSREFELYHSDLTLTVWCDPFWGVSPCPPLVSTILQSSSEVPLPTGSAPLLSAPHLLLSLCCLVASNSKVLLATVNDIHHLLRASTSQIEWNSFIDLAETHRLLTPILSGCALAREVYDSPLPEEIELLLLKRPDLYRKARLSMLSLRNVDNPISSSKRGRSCRPGSLGVLRRVRSSFADCVFSLRSRRGILAYPEVTRLLYRLLAPLRAALRIRPSSS